MPQLELKKERHIKKSRKSLIKKKYLILLNDHNNGGFKKIICK